MAGCRGNKPDGKSKAVSRTKHNNTQNSCAKHVRETCLGQVTLLHPTSAQEVEARAYRAFALVLKDSWELCDHAGELRITASKGARAGIAHSGGNSR